MEKRQTKLILLCCICLFAITGCLPKSIIDDVQLIQGVVFDKGKQSKVKATFVCPVQQKGNKVQIFQSEGHTVKQVKANASLEAFQPFASGQLRVALFTKQLAKKGVSSAFDTLIRDVTIGNLLYVGLLEGDGFELFSGKYTTSANVAIYITKMLEHNMKSGPLPTDNLYLNSYRYYRYGQDTYMPILKKSKDKIKITGLALFKKDRYVGEIAAKDLFVFKGLLENHRLDTHEFKTKQGYTMITNIHSTPTYHVDIKNGKPSFLIKVKMKASIPEISTSINLEQRKNTKQIEKSIENQLNISAAKLIKKTQSLDVDPLGLGAKYRQHDRSFQLKEWKKMYKDVPIVVQHEVMITNSGVIE